MDEIFETATLVQTRKIRDFPLVLMGREYWQGLLEFMDHSMVHERTISPQDVERFFVTDSPADAVEHVLEAATKRFGMVWRRHRRARRLLGERAPREDRGRGVATG